MRQLQKLTGLPLPERLYVDEVDMQPLVERHHRDARRPRPPFGLYRADEMKGVQESFEGVQRHRRIQHPAGHGHRGQYDRRGPAERVGVQPNDRIVRIDTLDAVGFKQTDVPKYLRGKTGSKVEIDVVRQGERNRSIS